MHIAATVPESPTNFTTQRPSTSAAAEDQLWDEVGIWVQIMLCVSQFPLSSWIICISVVGQHAR